MVYISAASSHPSYLVSSAQSDQAVMPPSTCSSFSVFNMARFQARERNDRRPRSPSTDPKKDGSDGDLNEVGSLFPPSAHAVRPECIKATDLEYAPQVTENNPGSSNSGLHPQSGDSGQNNSFNTSPPPRALTPEERGPYLSPKEFRELKRQISSNKMKRSSSCK